MLFRSVTEPGVLQGHHLITRLTNNNGNFSFDAQVRLDFNATDSSGRPIWSPNNLFYGIAATGSATLPESGQLSGDAEFFVTVDGGTIEKVVVRAVDTLSNGSRRDLVADIDAALQATPLAGRVSARLTSNRLAIIRTATATQAEAAVTVSAPNAVASGELGLAPADDETIISANIGCIQHLQSGTATPVRHWVEVLDDALNRA